MNKIAVLIWLLVLSGQVHAQQFADVKQIFESAKAISVDDLPKDKWAWCDFMIDSHNTVEKLRNSRFKIKERFNTPYVEYQFSGEFISYFHGLTEIKSEETASVYHNECYDLDISQNINGECFNEYFYRFEFRKSLNSIILGINLLKTPISGHHSELGYNKFISCSY